ACYLALSLASVQRALRATVSTATRASIGMALLVVAIGAYCLGSGLPLVPHVAAYALYLFVPLVMLTAARTSTSGARRGPDRQIRQILAAVLLWLPLSLGWLKLRLAGGFDASHLVAMVAALYL